MKILLDNFSCALVLILCFSAVALFIMYGKKIAKMKQLKGKIEKLEKSKTSSRSHGRQEVKEIINKSFTT